MRPPNPNHYESDWDYYEAQEAYQAYLDGTDHPALPLFVRQQMAYHNPDSNQFIEPNERN